MGLAPERLAAARVKIVVSWNRILWNVQLDSSQLSFGKKDEAADYIRGGRQDEFINFLSFHLEEATTLCSGGLQ